MRIKSHPLSKKTWPSKYSLIVMMSLGISLVSITKTVSAADFRINNDGTVTDQDTNLTWPRQITSVRFSWENAFEYCHNLSIAGGGWRLPKLKELSSIIDFSKTNPFIDQSVFEGVVHGYYWTATSDAQDINDIWSIDFMFSEIHPVSSLELRQVQCVRQTK